MGQLQPHPTCTRQGRPGCPRVSPLLGQDAACREPPSPCPAAPRQGQAGWSPGPCPECATRVQCLPGCQRTVSPRHIEARGLGPGGAQRWQRAQGDPASGLSQAWSRAWSHLLPSQFLSSLPALLLSHHDLRPSPRPPAHSPATSTPMTSTLLRPLPSLVTPGPLLHDLHPSP